MNEEDESPSGSQSVQSNPMDSLNDDITPKTADQDKRKESIWTKIIHKFGLEKRSVVHKLENELKMKSKENELLKDELESNKSLMSEMENEMQLKSDEIENLESRISQLEGEAQSMIDNLKNTEIMIGSKFTEMSKLTEENVYSQPTEHAGITWKMSVNKDRLNRIWFNLHGEKESAVEWFCPVIAQFLMFSQKSKELVYRNEWKLVYDEENSSDWLKRISHKDLFNEEKGSVKDDSVIVAVAIREHPRIDSEFPETTIRCEFTDISKLTEEEVYSEPTEHAGVTWELSVFKDTDNSITFCLNGKKENDVDWIYLVNTEFRLISQKSQEFDRKMRRKLIYDAENSVYWIAFISCKDLFNEEKGFVNDDSINVAVTIRGIPTD